MKEIKDLKFPEDLRYSEDHEWARREGDQFVIGISDYAQDQLGDIVFTELPEPGKNLEKGQEFGTVESVKAVSELFMPLAGEVTAVNNELVDSPELINNDPYGRGWMVRIKPSDSAHFETLMDRSAYLATLEQS